MSTDRFTEILNCLSAMSRAVGGFCAEVDSHPERLEARANGLKTRLGALESETRAGFEQLRADIRLMNRKFDVAAKDFVELRA